MERVTRKPFQGVFNIIRFNWHFYLLSAMLLAAGLFFRHLVPVQVLLWALVAATVLSLGVSWYIYDASRLYELQWLDGLHIHSGAQIVNINAGFDETSQLLSQKYPGALLRVFDFYDPAKHTEVSIERARKVYPAYPGTETINTSAIPLPAASADVIFLFLAAHEIRDGQERSIFFEQLRHSLRENGRMVVLEHLRDARNFAAYNIGFLHFFSGAAWRQVFASAGLRIEKEIKITPFLSAFILYKNGTAS
ncbi:methyltransferase [Chitinophaga sp. 22321]|uniref:Methyltransferase n=1 Tax=Chitinophaga hostae TaxID=2831022 RepID=A0ABS5IXX8_9BACT|nr:methyltransferase [Chitinophaga hostae]MBS0027791.1 methyltransferase [Chitinophaga hostae]